MQNLIAEYISQLEKKEQIVLKIAKEHLETSFDIEKSIGFKQWCKARKELACKELACKELACKELACKELLIEK